MIELAAVYECVNAAAELYEVPKPIARAFARVVGIKEDQNFPRAAPAAAGWLFEGRR